MSGLPPLIPNLPDDIASRCIALLPLSSHPTLSLVSRSWHSLLLSPLLFNLRARLLPLEPVLFISIRTPFNPSLCFILRPSLPRNPQPVPSPPISVVGSACCTLGPIIYILGGSHDGIPTRAVQIFDSRTCHWLPGPSMFAAREFAAVGSIGEQIYVVGGCLPSTPSWAESLDPTSCRWNPVPCPAYLRDKWMHGNAVLDGKLLAVADRGGVLFDPRTMMWGPVSSVLDLGWKGRATVVGRVLYTYDYLGKIKGYDPEMDQWRQVEGLERELPKFLCGATLANLGGMLCLVWEGCRTRKMVDASHTGVDITRWREVVEISFAGIKISRMKDGAFRGSVIWLENAVLDVPRGSTIAHCITFEL